MLRYQYHSPTIQNQTLSETPPRTISLRITKKKIIKHLSLYKVSLLDLKVLFLLYKKFLGPISSGLIFVSVN